MARITVTMTALGNEPTPCEACGESFCRGSQISAFEYENGEKLGWFCQACTLQFQKWGEFDPQRIVAESSKRKG